MAVRLHSSECWPDDLAHDPLRDSGGHHRSGGVRTHATGIRPAVTVVACLVVL